ncbi:aldo/keto reductase [Colletotrichum cuscutae]|uniref:Aldo/keto reductase n=1 Tax=Colletotrichum cuscutae TaxID=1209917 RepID=A0AAI9Y800_9PEZI|nr:aldo/keto reductase [Colletotrichum cuscutae]
MDSTTLEKDAERYVPLLDLTFGTLYVSVTSHYSAEFVDVFRQILEVGIVSSTDHIEDVEEQERKVGKIIKNSKVDRKKFFVTIKVHAPLPKASQPKHFTFQKLRSEADTTMKKTLERLQLDYVDLILLHDAHAVIKDEAFKEAWEILGRFTKEIDEKTEKTRCRFRGLSNFDKSNFWTGNSEVAIETTSLRSGDFPDFRHFQEGKDSKAYHEWFQSGSELELEDEEARKRLRDIFNHREKYLHKVFTDRSISEKPRFMFLDPPPFHSGSVSMYNFLGMLGSRFGATPSDVLGKWASITPQIRSSGVVGKLKNEFHMPEFERGQIDFLFNLSFKISVTAKTPENYQ